MSSNIHENRIMSFPSIAPAISLLLKLTRPADEAQVLLTLMTPSIKVRRTSVQHNHDPHVKNGGFF